MYIIKVAELIVILSGKRKDVNSSKVRVAKWRNTLSEESKKTARANNALQKKNQRSEMTDEERQQARKIDKEKKALKRAAMTEEEKSKIRGK